MTFYNPSYHHGDVGSLMILMDKFRQFEYTSLGLTLPTDIRNIIGHILFMEPPMYFYMMIDYDGGRHIISSDITSAQKIYASSGIDMIQQWLNDPKMIAIISYSSSS